MSLLSLLKPNGPSGFGFRSSADEVLEGLRLEGSSVLVTGCASGLGAETMRALARKGARVFGTARTDEAARSACAGVPGAVPVPCDLSEARSVNEAVEAVRRTGVRLDAIVANAGIMAIPEATRKHGWEMQLLINHVGHHQLVTRLLASLADTGRVVVVSSSAHANAPPEGIRFDDLGCGRWYDAWGAYGQSKLANILFVKELSRRLGPRQTAIAVHPGIVRTGLQRHLSPAMRAMYPILGPLAFKTIAQGAATQCYAAAHPSAAAARGARPAGGAAVRASVGCRCGRSCEGRWCFGCSCSGGSVVSAGALVLSAERSGRFSEPALVSLLGRGT